jgi:hypothetical protein
MKRILLIVALTTLGVIIGYTVAWGLWEMSNPDHAPENFAGDMWGLMLGAPVGRAIGLLSGTSILAIRWFRHRSNKTRGEPRSDINTTR